MDQALETILKKKAKNILFVLNDHIADGTDVSWIWDIDIETLVQISTIRLTLSGERVYDLSLRFKYANADMNTITIESDVNLAINKSLMQTGSQETLYILATYTAMLEVRKLLTGKGIL